MSIRSRHLRRSLVITKVYALAAILVGCGSAYGDAVSLTKNISREDPLIDVAKSQFELGRDGNLYFQGSGGGNSVIVRIARDGSGKISVHAPEALVIATANSAGVIAGAFTHFQHAVEMFDAGLQPAGSVNGFLVSDKAGWDAPAHVEAGDSDFYAVDQHRNRVVVLSPDAKIVTSYPVRADTEPTWGPPGDFRVCENLKAFYWNSGGVIRCTGFDGKTRFTVPDLGIGGSPWDGFRGGFDVDTDGTLYLMGPRDQILHRYSPEGQSEGAVPLQMAGAAPTVDFPVTGLRVFHGEAVVKRQHPRELFSVYSLATGEKERTVDADVESLSVSFPSEVWTAGQTVPLTINLDAAPRSVTPHWRVWLRPFGTARFNELPLVNGLITAPAGAGGLYQVRVCPGVAGASSEYEVDDAVEIRAPGALGSAAVLTPGSRVYYSRGETIPFKVVLRCAPGDMPKTVTVRLDGSGTEIARQTFPAASDGTVSGLIPDTVTRLLRPGQYSLTVELKNFTVAAQTIELGPGLGDPVPFRNVEYGDYNLTYDGTPTIWNAPETEAGAVERASKLSKNLFVDRLTWAAGQTGLAWSNTADGAGGLAQIAARLGRDPMAVAPEKAQIEPPLQQLLGGYGAQGVSEMSILMSMDAGLPTGTGFDTRTPAQLADAITGTTTPLLSFPAFRGWTWAANWWPTYFGVTAAKDATQKAAYDTTLKKANDTGAWDPVLDEVSDTWRSYAPTATDTFAQILHKTAPNLVSASAGPYRSVSVYPPITFKNLDEVDLHYQSEQIQPPQVYPHNVDFQTRPGKPSWAHPELWNDNGTGNQILNTSFQMLMRGAQGIGNSGDVPNWGRLPEDPRQPYFGNASIYRALGDITKEYGPWLTTLTNADRVAILCSPRMFRIDNWGGIGGKHFTRLYEAYQACLYAHSPASFVFPEDMNPGTLAHYRAVLVVDQRVELEPALKAALDAAKAAGTTVFYDDTCRTEDVSAYTPLGMAFDQVDADHSRGWNDDSAYLRFADYFHKDADLLAPRLAAIAPPVAAVGARDVLLSERDSGGGRYIFLVNNTLPDLQQGALWRVADTITTRSPVRTSVQLPPADVVYDVFALSRLDPANFKIACDLTSLPARLYALLPAPIDRVALSGPASMVAGHSFQWKVAVLSAAGQPIDAGIPVHLRLVSGDGAVLQERYLSANRPAASGNWTVPVNAAGNLTLEATELISGKTATLTMPVTPGQLVAFAPPTGEAVPAKVSASGQASDFSLAVGQHFGPHFRDLAVSQDGSVALINAMNWDTNCFGIDTATGKLQFAQKLGDWFALAPEQAGDGFAVQGYDLSTAQGYHLYLAGKDGIVTRRFAAYALPKRMTSWSFPHLVDHDDNFAVAPNGDWVANDGDLGLAVWSRDGKLLWSQDWRADRHTAVLLAAGNQRLVVARGARVEEYEAVTGKLNWSLSVSPDGSILGGTVSVDGRTVILRSDNDGGRVFVVRDGQTVARLDSMAEDLSLSPDGQSVALVNGKELRWYDIESGLQWNLEGDDYLHFPRISPDGKRVVVSSEIGTVYVLSSSGGLLLEKDLGSLTAPAWLDQGDLLLATWDGDVVRLASTDYLEKWRVHLTTQPLAPPSAAGMTVPTSRMDNWINAAVKPASLTPNLLTDTKALFSILGGDRPDELENPVSLLTDGSITPPPTPWVSWFDINYVDSGWVGKTSLQFDTFRTQIHLTGITLVEDPNHPESWLRDAVLQYWDPVKEAWIDGPTLLSDSAIHTHYFDKPIEAAKFRLVSSGNGSGWPVGNIRLAEVVFHGSILGSSSPDVIAKHPVAVLFDEQESDVQTMQGFGKNGHINYADAFAGGKSLEIETGKTLAPPSNPGFGTAMPNWDYEIDENPQPGQYRYLKFAWKAPSPTTDAMAISVGGVEVYVGRSLLKDTAGAKASEDISDTPPVAWTEVTVDLWKDLKAPTHIYGMTLASAGGPALFDDIRLSQSP